MFKHLDPRPIDTATLQNFPKVLEDFERRDKGEPFVYTTASGEQITVDEGVAETLPPWATDKNGKLDRNAVVYELLDITMPDGTTEKYLKMGNASEDKIHVECVTEDCDTVAKALAFRAAMEYDEFKELNGLDADGNFTKLLALA